MPSVSPITKSPVAKYLSANKARPVHEGNVCHFFSPEGLYLGRQIKHEVQGIKFFTTTVVGENFQPMFTKSVVIAPKKQYFKDDKFRCSLSLVTTNLAKKVFFLDFFKNKYNITQTENVLQNKIDLIAVDETQQIGLYQTNRPYIYEEKIVREEIDLPFEKSTKKSKFTYN